LIDKVLGIMGEVKVLLVHENGRRSRP